MPVALAGLVIQYVVLRVGFRKVLGLAVIQRPAAQPPPLNRRLLFLTLAVLGLVFVGFVAGLNLSWTALAGGALVMVLAKRDTHQVLKLVDWNLLVFFAALFIVVEGLSKTGLPDQTYRHVQPLFGSSTASQAWNFAWFSALGSNVFSNVPFVLVAGKWINNFAHPELMWKVMALTTTFAGNLTIVGSVANLIVFESARKEARVEFWEYCKVGAPLAVGQHVAHQVEVGFHERHSAMKRGRWARKKG